MKSHTYIGITGAVIFVALVFLEVAFQSYFFNGWHFIFFIIAGYGGIAFAIYATNNNWKASLTTAIKIVGLVLLFGLILGLLKKI